MRLWADADPPDSDLTPHLLIQLEDDLERSRMREAFWISVVVHLMVVIFLVMSPKMFPAIKGVDAGHPADLMSNQQLTYLDLPPDVQKAPKPPPETNVLSDKNRIAESRHPSLDKKTLEELKRAGPPECRRRHRSRRRCRRRRSKARSSRTRRRTSRWRRSQPVPQENPKLPCRAEAARRLTLRR